MALRLQNHEFFISSGFFSGTSTWTHHALGWTSQWPIWSNARVSVRIHVIWELPWDQMLFLYKCVNWHNHDQRYNCFCSSALQDKVNLSRGSLTPCQTLQTLQSRYPVCWLPWHSWGKLPHTAVHLVSESTGNVHVKMAWTSCLALKSFTMDKNVVFQIEYLKVFWAVWANVSVHLRQKSKRHVTRWNHTEKLLRWKMNPARLQLIRWRSLRLVVQFYFVSSKRRLNWALTKKPKGKTLFGVHLCSRDNKCWWSWFLSGRWCAWFSSHVVLETLGSLFLSYRLSDVPFLSWMPFHKLVMYVDLLGDEALLGRPNVRCSRAWTSYEGNPQSSVRRQFWRCSSGFDSHFPTLGPQKEKIISIFLSKLNGL